MNAQFIDPWNYILKDPKAEKKWVFCLNTSLQRSKTEKLLGGFTFKLLCGPNINPVVEGGVYIFFKCYYFKAYIVDAIKSCGGITVTTISDADARSQHFYIVSREANRASFSELVQTYPNTKVISHEGIYDTVLRQELCLSGYELDVEYNV